jgi:uncharacterized protein
MPERLIQEALGLTSGALVGFSLGLVGGGGSILAVPLMIYLVGVPSTHVAIGTSALAVAVNAAANLVQHARNGTVKWRCASVFAAAGMLGAFAGSSLSKMVDGQKLLVLFALFGIGGGFLITPGLMLATGMPILNAVASSLVAVAAFGMTGAANYARSGFVDWWLGAIFIGGGVLGGVAGARLAATLGKTRGRLNVVFAGVIFAVAIYMLVRGIAND